MFFYFSIGKLHKNTPQNFLICPCGSSLEGQTIVYFLSPIMAPASIFSHLLCPLISHSNPTNGGLPML